MAHTRTDLNNDYGFTMKRFERSGIEDYSDDDDEFEVIAGECEEFCGGILNTCSYVSACKFIYCRYDQNVQFGTTE